MRFGVVPAVLILTAVPAAAQNDPDAPPPRYGVESAPRAYPQNTPQLALGSAIRAAERGKTDFLLAHLLEPTVGDALVRDKAKQIEVAVERDLRALREVQRAAAVPPPFAERVPDDVAQFNAAVRREAVARAFRLVARDVANHLSENPDLLRDLRRFLRDGQFVDAGETATATLPGVPERQVTFRKVGGRWFVEDRQLPEPPPPGK